MLALRVEKEESGVVQASSAAAGMAVQEDEWMGQRGGGGRGSGLCL